MGSREPSSLDLFLLALIDSGLTTPYEFQRQAGISVGASLPALRYLLSRRLVVRGKQGERRRMKYSITREGKALLRNAASFTPAESSDLPSTLRSAILTGYMGRRSRTLQLLEQYRAEISESPGPDKGFDLRSPAETYRWMITVRDRYQQKADLQAVSEIIRMLKQKQR